MRSVIELREVSTLKSNQRDQSRTAWSLYLEKQTSVSLLQRHSQCDDLLTLIALLINESNYYVHVQLVSLLQRRDSNRSLQWVNRSSHSESATMTRSTVSLLQWRVRYWSRHRVSHSIVSLLERHSKWVCYKDRQRLIFWLSRSMNETSSTM